jgi:deoxyribodipyrimidine photolyase-related protein
MYNVIVLPTTLFEKNELITENTHVYLVEHYVYFEMYNYNKLKIILHRSTMKYYYDYIKKHYKCNITYISYYDNIKDILLSMKYKDVYIHDPHDHIVLDFFIKLFNKKSNIQLHIKESKLFLTPSKDLKIYYNDTLNKKIIQNNFYKWQRKRLHILMEKNIPIGNKWTYDSYNREAFPKNIKDVYKIKIQQNKYINEAIDYVNNYFSKNPGSLNFYLPITHKYAKIHVKKFIKERLQYFGKYQDSVNSGIFLGYHSLIAPLMNIGLVTPKYVITQIINFYNKHKKNITIQTVEGFIRQVIGWREFCNFMYTFYRKELETPNYFGNNNKLNKNIWYYKHNSTGFELIDNLIDKTINYGYLHHIERLMYIGNFLLLTKTNPTDVFNWFQSMFLDSYHVFMYPNVYGMSQYSAGGIMMTRPYFSSSNYINKMSNYKRNSHNIQINKNIYSWNNVWDALYYNFINENKDTLKTNYSLANSVNNWHKKSQKDKKMIIMLAHAYIKNYS